MKKIISAVVLAMFMVTMLTACPPAPVPTPKAPKVHVPTPNQIIELDNADNVDIFVEDAR